MNGAEMHPLQLSPSQRLCRDGQLLSLADDTLATGTVARYIDELIARRARSSLGASCAQCDVSLRAHLVAGVRRGWLLGISNRPSARKRPRRYEQTTRLDALPLLGSELQAISGRFSSSLQVASHRPPAPEEWSDAKTSALFTLRQGNRDGRGEA